jgi:tRNA 2-thiouridine synthesizing protein D
MATITIGLMDPPYESSNIPTAFRIIDGALRKGHNVNVFLYEGATGLGFTGQKKHANAVKGTSVEDEDHALPREWIASLFELAKEKGVKLDWINCGLCVDERGVEAQVEGTRRGSPVDAWKAFEASQGVLWIGTR